MTIYPDQSIRCEQNETQELLSSLPNYRQSETEGLGFILLVPDFPDCRHRDLQIKTSNCGKKTGRYRCSILNNETVSVPFCKACKLDRS